MKIILSCFNPSYRGYCSGSEINGLKPKYPSNVSILLIVDIALEESIGVRYITYPGVSILLIVDIALEAVAVDL